MCFDHFHSSSSKPSQIFPSFLRTNFMFFLFQKLKGKISDHNNRTQRALDSTCPNSFSVRKMATVALAVRLVSLKQSELDLGFYLYLCQAEYQAHKNPQYA